MSQDKHANVSRRTLLKGMAAAAGTTMLPGMLSSNSAYAAAGTGKPETTKAKLGFIALSDAAPLLVADEKGFFKKHGMTEVEVLKQSSWGTTRDNLVLGSARGGIDGAHILTPMPYLLTAGINSEPVAMSIIARLNLNGQCISVGNEYKDLNVGIDSTGFGKALAAKRASGKEIRAAMTFPGGTHDMWMRYWLAAGGIDPDKNISTIVVPPPQMVANMKVGSMDTFCVGEPWNLQLINQGIGYTANTTGELWNDHPEKALALRSDYIAANPRATKALLMAVMEAQIYCEQPENKEEVAAICAKRRWFNAPVTDIVDRMKGHFDYGTGKVIENHPQLMRYWSHHASYPFQSHDLWFLVENQRWGIIPKNYDLHGLIAKVNREDIWRDAAATLGIDKADIPASVTRGKERFFDGVVFDPANPQAYLNQLKIRRV